MNCRFRDPSLHNQCKIPTTEWVADRAGANFCDEFDYEDSEAKTSEAIEHDEARRALDSLFGDSSGPRKKPRSLDDLLGGLK